MEVLTAAERSRLLDAIREKLTHEPFVETRNRKPLRPNPIAPWELRVDRLRVFYEIRPPESSDHEGLEPPAGVVYVLAVGKKVRRVLRIAGEVFEI